MHCFSREEEKEQLQIVSTGCHDARSKDKCLLWLGSLLRRCMQRWRRQEGRELSESQLRQESKRKVKQNDETLTTCASDGCNLWALVHVEGTLDGPVSSSLGGRQPFLQVTHMAMDSNHRLCTETHRVSAKNMVVLLVLGLCILLILIYNKVARGICSPMNPNLTWIFGSEEATRSKSKDPVLSWPNTFFHMTGCS